MTLLSNCGPWEYNYGMLGAQPKYESFNAKFVHPMCYILRAHETNA